MLEIYNSYSKKKEKFKPVNEKKVNIYTCGPTVYSNAHVGNFSAFLMADILVRYFKYNGYDVKWVMNITDVGHLTDDNEITDDGEDKLEAASKRENKTVWEIARHYENIFLEDIRNLKLLPAFKYPRATEHVDEMIEMIKKLEEKGVIYETSDGLYFDIAKFADYGKLSGNILDDLQAGSRIEINEDKRSPFDFAVWKKLTGQNLNHAMKWESPWGTGFPGWHIECSAMSKKYLGETLDFHTGGEDNKFPHHESEIAQSETANCKPFANYWMHKSRVVVNNEKMSKSLGNFFTVSDLLKLGYTPEAIRFTFVSVHYRSKLNFTEEKLIESQKTIDKFNDFIQFIIKSDEGQENKSVSSVIKSTKQQSDRAMDDDLNVSSALASVFGFIKSIRKQVNKSGISRHNKDEILYFMKSVNSIFDVFDFEEKKEKELNEEEQKIVDELIKKREQFRAEKNWVEADRIRDELNRMGVKIEDKNRVLVLFVVLFSLVITSCSIKGKAVGKDEEIIVVADEEMFDMFKPDLENIYSDPIYTPMLENRFTLKRISLKKFKENGYKFKNIIMLADIDDDSPESEYISAIFSDKIKEGVRESEYYYVVKNDIWAKDQLVLFLLNSKEMYLAQYLVKQKDKIFNIFNDKLIAKVKDSLFDRFNSKGAEEIAKEKKGIDIFVPHDFAVVNEGKETDFIRFRRFNPDRWLTVIKGEYDENLSLEENIIVMRNAAGREFGDSVRINPDLLTFRPDSTFAKGCIKAQGLWEYELGGGPFFTYGYEKNGILYLVDGAVFAPQKAKYPYIMQLDLMARTVRFPE